MTPAERAHAITSALLPWFDAARRDLPWRRTKNPYHIWISEIMLQQTQVATVIPYFERFLAHFPTVSALASAPEAAVLKAWEGLGYYSRARNLQAAARQVDALHAGRMPGSYDALRSLPGIGDYTAGAIGSIAFDLVVPAVDGNVIRVVSRLFAIEDDVTRPATRRAIASYAASLLPADRPGDLNEALMELGATVCTPTSPRCVACPAAAFCLARARSIQANLPVKPKKAAPRAVTWASALVVRDGRVLLVHRPADGIWGGMWALPLVELAADDAESGGAIAAWLAAGGLQVAVGPVERTLSHTLTHRRLTIPVHRVRYLSGEPNPTRAAWVAPADLARYPLPVPFKSLASWLDLGPLFRSPGESR